MAQAGHSTPPQKTTHNTGGSSRRSRARNESPPTSMDALIATLTGHPRHSHSHNQAHNHNHSHQPSSPSALLVDAAGDAESRPRAKPSKKKSVHLNTLLNNELYKTEMCRSFEETGSCRYGSRCQFAHGLDDLRIVERHPRYKTEICKTFIEKGFCAYGKRCRFLHSLNPNAAAMATGSETDAASECDYDTHEPEPYSHYDIDFPPCARRNLFPTEVPEAASGPLQSHLHMPNMSFSYAPDSPSHTRHAEDEVGGYQHQEPLFDIDFEALAWTEPESRSPQNLGDMPQLRRTQGVADADANADADSTVSHDADHCYGSEHSFGHDSESDARSIDSPMQPFGLLHGYWGLPRIFSQHHHHHHHHRRLPVFEQIAN